MKAVVTGCLGQDGSLLCEYLAGRGYEVVGMMRRHSTPNLQNVQTLLDDESLRLVEGDLTDSASLRRVLASERPDLIFNLGAQSHVGTSFEQPETTLDATGLGALRVYQAVRDVQPRARVYQASSSECYGNTRPQAPDGRLTELDHFQPASPYGAAKALAHHLAHVYRRAYNLHISCGILFNHECLDELTPVVIRRLGRVEVVSPRDLIAVHGKGASVQTCEPDGVEIWDGSEWVGLTLLTATRRRSSDPDHQVLDVEARAGVTRVTAHHKMLTADLNPIKAGAVLPRNRLALATSPVALPEDTLTSDELAEFLGHMAAEGWVATHEATYTNNDPSLRARVGELAWRLFGVTSAEDLGRSGFTGADVGRIRLHTGRFLSGWLRSLLYQRHALKQVPPLVLNAPLSSKRAFIRGYYAGDGLKAGNGESVKTNSPFLAQGLVLLYAACGRTASVYVEHRGEATYYQLNLSTATPRGAKGAHLRKDPHEVRKVTPVSPSSEWVYDLETASHRLMAGVGHIVVHNSERRGVNFVTRKITRGLARIRVGLQDRLTLGNIDAIRDWGHAEDYVVAMHAMALMDEPGDYVVATGVGHTVADFLHAANKIAGVDPAHIRFMPEERRPYDVDRLVGNPTKANERLDWRPHTSFAGLASRMMHHDLHLAAKEVRDA